MKTLLKSFAAGLLALVLAAPAAQAQPRQAFSQPELDQMLAPIALYPDPLLSQILMAATYPLEVVQAARWSRANEHLAGEQAVHAVEPMDWDPSVKSLVAFPQVLDRMDERLEWTERLGEAFLAQEARVMDTIQDLRRRAVLAGHLDPNEYTRVLRDGDVIVIEPAHPQVVYVPYYDPAVVYGAWLWPAHPPVYWAPWPGHVARTAYAPGYLWGGGTVIRIGFFFGHFDWPQRHVQVVHHHHHKVVVHEHTKVIHRPAPQRWEHDPRHRRGVPFRHTVTREVTHVHDDRRSQRPDARRDSWPVVRHDAEHAARRGEDRGERRADRREDRRDERRSEVREERRDQQQPPRREQRRDDRQDGRRADLREAVREDKREEHQGARRAERGEERRHERPPARVEERRTDGQDARREQRRDDRHDASSNDAGRSFGTPRADGANRREAGSTSRPSDRAERAERVAPERGDRQARRPAPQPNATTPGPNGRGAVTQPPAPPRAETRIVRAAASADDSPNPQRRRERRAQNDAD